MPVRPKRISSEGNIERFGADLGFAAPPNVSIGVVLDGRFWLTSAMGYF